MATADNVCNVISCNLFMIFIAMMNFVTTELNGISASLEEAEMGEIFMNSNKGSGEHLFLM